MLVRPSPCAPTTTLLRDAGQALYGPSWRGPMARALDVAERTIYRWDRGQTTVPPGVVADLLRLVRERGIELRALAQRLERAA